MPALHTPIEIFKNAPVYNDLTARESVRYAHQKRKKASFRHCGQPCRVSDAREQPHWDSYGRICIVVYCELVYLYMYRGFRSATSQVPGRGLTQYTGCQDDVSIVF